MTDGTVAKRPPARLLRLDDDWNSMFAGILASEPGITSAGTGSWGRPRQTNLPIGTKAELFG